MQLADERTLEILDFESVRRRVVAQTRTERGRERAAALAPLASLALVRAEQSATAWIRELVERADFHVLPARDTRDLTAAARRGVALSAEDLRAVGEALGAAAAAHGRLREAQSTLAASVSAGYRPLRELQHAIFDAIDERGTVLERASPALARIRKQLQQAQGEARERVASLLRSAKYAKAIQEPVVTIREGRFVVPVKAEFSGEFPGIVHDTSSSGQTLFVEPLGALESNNRVRRLRIDEEREIARILEALSRAVGSQAETIEANVEMLARLDVLAAKANVAREMDAVEPELGEEPVLTIREGRHPLLGARCVPQSLELNDRTRLLVVSGPNMGGKTVVLKMAGLFVAMAYSGMQIPSGPGTRIGGFARIFADIGDEQSIAQNASTFSAHLYRMREIVESADERSLVLVDEIGGGTEPASGAALAVAILERLLAVRAYGIVTTHATELKLFAHATPGVANASVRFDAQSFAPTYHLDLGTPGQSLAFPLARTVGIAPGIVERAASLLSSRERDYETALAQLANVHAALQMERDELDRERTALRARESVARAQLEALERERERFAARAEERLQTALRAFAAELERRQTERGQAVQPGSRPRITTGQSALLARTLEAMRRDLGLQQETAQTGESGTLSPGDRVRVLSFGQDGTVIADEGERVLVAVGAMRALVGKDDVRRLGNAAVAPQQAGARAGSARLEAAVRTMTELDVRGKRYAEAQPLVERWIDDALLAGNTPLRLIHGKGTGMLGRGLQEYLRAHPSVSSVRYGTENEGGAGVTILELREN